MSSGTPSARTLVVDDSDESIRRAVELLRAGRLVAVPTETVYGLAADASSPTAVARVFAVKGRPADHPLIVHIHTASALDRWVGYLPGDARKLADAFWPGPLTMVLPRHASVPPAVTGGRDTVAVRVPAHPVIRRLLEAFGGGLAAPSANRFGRVSPTTAADVVADLDGAVDLVIDGGRCEIGVESTIVEVSDDDVTILRPGGITAEAMAAVLGHEIGTDDAGPARAPGMLASHYAPDARIELCEADEAADRVARHSATGERVGLLSPTPLDATGATVAWDAGGDPAVFARSLYRWLRQADEERLSVLVVVPPPAEGIGIAVRDRLRRAAHR